ncbi:MAG: DUF503 domain-containing protein [Phycisphaerales bacterium]|nr:DUF503 domain-containing protein [Phycisphaerales bacterium]
MFIGILQFELVIVASESLKDKRSVVKSLKDRLHREHLCSVAEVGALDDHRLAFMGLAVVAESARRCAEVLDRISVKLRAVEGAQLGDCSRQIVSAADVSPDTADDGSPLWTPQESRRAEEPRA